MRVLLSCDFSFYLSRKAVLRARELGAVWASEKYCPLVELPETWPEALEDRYEIWRNNRYRLNELVPRHDPILLQIFDELGAEMEPPPEDGDLDGFPKPDEREIRALEIPEDVRYAIHSYLGEWIAEAHRVWDWEGETRVQGPVFDKYSTFHDWKD